ncbi:MAG: FHA domain-containing protein, partial [Chloroflexota bacterium]
RPDVDLVERQGGRTVSRRHARIRRTDGGWIWKVESAARSATAVAGRALVHDQEASLHDGDQITLGSVSIEFRGDREPPASDANATLVGVGPNLTAAEIRAGDRVIPVSVPEGRVLSVGRHSDDLRYRPDVDLRDVRGGATISRRHAELYRHESNWFLRVQADVMNPTFVNDVQLEPRQEVALNDGDQLRLGRAIATFHAYRRARYVDSDVLQLVVGPPTDVALEPGARHLLPVTLSNFSGQVDWFLFEVAGAPASWLRIVAPDGSADQPPLVRLLTSQTPVSAADATATVTLVCSPPRQAQARAGTYPLLITATSQGDDPIRRSATAQLTVLPFAELGLVAEPLLVRGGRGRYPLRVSNAGNASTCVAFGAMTDDPLKVKLDFEEVTLANGGEAPVELDVSVKRRPWLGPERTHRVRITASAAQAIAVQIVQLACPPRIPVWLQSVFARVQSLLKPVLIPLAMVAVALGFGYVLLRPPDVKLTSEPAVVAGAADALLTWDVDRGTGTATLESAAGRQQVALPRGVLNINPTQSQDYKLSARNWFGLTGTGSASIAVLRVLGFSASVDFIKQAGDPVTLQWTTEHATSVAIDPADEISSPGVTGKVIVHPTATTRYRLTASAEGSTATATAEALVSFGKPRITKFEQDHPQANPGDAVRLTWVAEGFSQLQLKASPNDLELTTDQDVTRRTSFQIRPLHSGDYSLVATNPDGTTDEAHVSMVVVPTRPPRLQAPAKPISAGETAQLSLHIEGANDRTTATITPDVGDVSGKTSVEIQPTHTTQYTLSVTGADGQTQTSEPVSVVVLPAVQQFSVAPAVITEGEPVLVSWKVADAVSVTISRDDGATLPVDAGTGDVRDRPGVSTTSYSLKARNASGESIETSASVAKIRVQPAPTPTPAPLPTPPLPPSPPTSA